MIVLKSQEMVQNEDLPNVHREIFTKTQRLKKNYLWLLAIVQADELFTKHLVFLNTKTLKDSKLHTNMR